MNVKKEKKRFIQWPLKFGWLARLSLVHTVNCKYIQFCTLFICIVYCIVLRVGQVSFEFRQQCNKKNSPTITTTNLFMHAQFHLAGKFQC